MRHAVLAAALLLSGLAAPALAQTPPAAEAAPSVDMAAAQPILMKTIADLQANKPDWTSMDPKLADALKPKIDVLSGQLASLGALKSLTPKGAGPQGSWVFTGVFEGATLDCLIHFGADKKIDGLYFKPVAQ